MEGGKEALLSPFYKGTNHIYKGSTLNLVDHLPKVPPPNITLRIKFQHMDRGKGTNIQSIVTTHLFFFFLGFVTFSFFSFLQLDYVFMVSFSITGLFFDLTYFLCFVGFLFFVLWFFYHLQCTSFTDYNLLSNMSFSYSV